ncbi:MAG: TonB-dependent receptor [Gammaproteobacteria bacterium]
MNYSRLNRGLLFTLGLVVSATGLAEVEEITVTAQRKDANLQEVPIAVSAFSMEDMSKLQINAVSDVAAAVPNMQTYTVTSNASAMQLFMRGAGVQNPGFNASESPVGLYVDDIYFGRLATANVDLTDIERTEVLRGPQGTLYGRNTIAGAMKFVTRTPGDETYGDISLGYGNYRTRKISATLGGALIEGKLAGSISALDHKRDDGWIDRPLGGRDMGEYENNAVRGKLHWYGSDNFSAQLSVTYIDVENDGYNGIPYGPSGQTPAANPGKPLAGFYDSLVAQGNEGFGETDQLNLGLSLTWDFAGMTLKSISGYSDIDDEFGFDLTGGGSELSGGFVPVPFNIVSDSNNKTISQEFNLSGGAFEDRLEWITGVFYMNEDGDQQYNPGAGSIFALIEDVDTETDSYAVYGEGTWNFTDKFSLIAGGRWSRDEKDYTNDCSGACAPAPWSVDLDEDFDEFTGRLIAEYQTNENLMLFAGFSQGYQAGGFQTLCLGNQACANIVYDNQTVDSWEAGVKSEWFDSRLRFNSSVWYAQYDDIQQTVVDTSINAFPLVNAGDADVLGLDIETYWSPNEYINTFLILGFADVDLDGSTEDSIQTDDLPGVADKTARIGFDVTYPVDFVDGWDFSFGLDVQYSDEYLSALAQSQSDLLIIDDYTRLNGFIGINQPDGPWSVVLSGTNLTDEDDNYSGIVGTAFTNIRTPQPPREYMLTAKYSF